MARGLYGEHGLATVHDVGAVWATQARADLRPEESLLLAVLNDACVAIRLGGRPAQEAALWFLDRGPQPRIRFREICDAFGLACTWIRRELGGFAYLVALSEGRGPAPAYVLERTVSKRRVRLAIRPTGSGA